MSDPLVRLIETAGNPRVLVVGDLMLDRYVWGEAGRISPEGPIPVLAVTSEEERPGGAGNVVTALANLGAKSAAEAALRLEKMGTGNDLSGADEAYAALEKEIECFSRALAALLEEAAK